MPKRYEQLKDMTEQCDEGALYATAMTLQLTTPNWREDQELKDIALGIADRLKHNGWTVELGVNQKYPEFKITPPEEVLIESNSYPLTLGREKAGVIRVGNFYVYDCFEE